MRRCLHAGLHFTSAPAVLQCRYALMARIAELQPVAFRPFSRIRSTASLRSSSVGDSVRSHLRLCLYHSSVAGETFVRYCRSRLNCSNLGSMVSSKASTHLAEENRVSC